MKSKVVEGTIIGYLRTSTDKQEINNQRLEILAYARKEDLKVSDFIDAQVSSRKSLDERKVGELFETLNAGDVLYPSPFRTDNKPSYSVSIHKNISYDFASIEVRDLVGVVAHHYGLSMSGALKKLEELLRIYPTQNISRYFNKNPQNRFSRYGK